MPTTEYINAHYYYYYYFYTALASLVASDMYEAAKVSTQVKSQTRHWPDFHGAMEQPSGRLPSVIHTKISPITVKLT